jgi:hypothetical protein
MELKRTSLLFNDGNSKPESPSHDDFVMAWAVDVTTGQPRYILELDSTWHDALNFLCASSQAAELCCARNIFR